MKRVWALLSAVGDSGFAAMGTFVVGLVAVIHFSTEQLALYSLIFAGTIVAGVLPRQLALIPIRTYANLRDPGSARGLTRDFAAAVPSLVLAAVIVVASGLPMAAETGLSYIAMTITAIGSLTLGAAQEHARAVLHMLRKHHAALGISIGGTIVTVASSLVGLCGTYNDAAPEWCTALIPFGALSLGFLASLGGYVIVTNRTPQSRYHFVGRLRDRVGYVWTALLFQAVGYSSNYMILLILGAHSLAIFESARVFAAPVLVIGTGLGNALKPRIIEAIGNRDPRLFRKRLMQLIGATVGFGAPFVLASAVLAASLGPLVGRTIDGPLTAARAASFIPESIAGNLGAVHLAARETRRWTVTSTWITAIEILSLPVGLLILGSYGSPVTHILSTGIRAWVGTRAVWSAADPEREVGD